MRNYMGFIKKIKIILTVIFLMLVAIAVILYNFYLEISEISINSALIIFGVLFVLRAILTWDKKHKIISFLELSLVTILTIIIINNVLKGLRVSSSELLVFMLITWIRKTLVKVTEYIQDAYKA